MLLAERGGEIVALQARNAEPFVFRLEIIFADPTVEDGALLVDRQHRGLVQLFEDVAKAKDHDLVADDEDSAVGLIVSSALRSLRMTSTQLSPPGGRW